MKKLILISLLSLFILTGCSFFESNQQNKYDNFENAQIAETLKLEESIEYELNNCLDNELESSVIDSSVFIIDDSLDVSYKIRIDNYIPKFVEILLDKIEIICSEEKSINSYKINISYENTHGLTSYRIQSESSSGVLIHNGELISVNCSLSSLKEYFDNN